VGTVSGLIQSALKPKPKVEQHIIREAVPRGRGGYISSTGQDLSGKSGKPSIFKTRLIDDDAFSSENVSEMVDHVARLDRFLRSPGEYSQAIAASKPKAQPTPNVPPVFASLSKFLKA